MFTDELRAQAAQLLDICRKKGITLATAESCTGGLIGALLTDIPGSSSVFYCGFATYSYESKTEILGVDPQLIKDRGAVSCEVAAAMAKGALEKSGAKLVVAVTGIAGPGGGTVDKPVGLVYIAAASTKSMEVERNLFDGNRNDVRLATVAKALRMLTSSVSGL